MAVNYYITGVPELQRLLEQAGRAPAKILTAATKNGANTVRKSALSGAPKDTGLLKRLLKLKAEKRKVGKKVYQLKWIGKGGFHGGLVKVGNGWRAFYPVSQEYGWRTRYMRTKKQGLFFIKRAYTRNRIVVHQRIIDDLTSALMTFIRSQHP